MAAERKQLILVDGSGYIFRAFHALPPMNTSRGLPTQAVYGFIRMLLKLLKDVRPSHIAIVFDSPKRTFRDDLFADYKANRSEAPNDLIVQIPYIHRAVEAFRIKSLMIEGFEADDVIGTLAKRAAKEDFAVTLITADKDFMQLVGPHVTLWDTMRDRRIGAREVRDRFGVEPSALVEIQALTGDTIDNIKGVPGVGEKTAAALVQKFGSVKGIYENLDHIEESGIRGAKKVAGLLAEHRAAVDLARKLVRIETDMPLKVEPDEFAWHGVDEKLGGGAAARVGVQFDHSRDLAVAGRPARSRSGREACRHRCRKRPRRRAQESWRAHPVSRLISRKPTRAGKSCNSRAPTRPSSSKVTGSRARRRFSAPSCRRNRVTI